MPQEFDPIPFEIDHVIAQKHRGLTVSENLALACFHCNSHKGPNIAGRDSETGRTVRLFNPRNDIWADHFVYDAEIMMAKTAIGRATIDVLEMNLPHRVAHRLALMEEGVFP